MTPIRSVLTLVVLVATLAGFPGESAGIDFIRGDANGDGVVTLADAAKMNAYLFWGLGLPCLSAADFNDDEELGVDDQLGVELFLLGPGDPPPPPYPGPGPDTTADAEGYQTTCDSYENQIPLEDPAALIRIHDAVAAGGDDVHAIITVSIAHSFPIWEFFGAIDIGENLVEDAEILGKDDSLEVLLDRDLIGSPSFKRAQVKGGRLQFGIMIPGPVVLSPQEEADVLEIKVCLRGGVPAGEYPLRLEVGDFVRAPAPGEDPESNPDVGRKIVPVLESATLTVLEDVQEYSTCRVRPLDGVNVKFTLGDAIAAVGRNAAVPMFVNGDREGHGFGFEILFDNDVLEALRIEQVFTRPDDLPFVDEFSEIDNEHGAVRGFFKSSSHSERHFLPPFQDNGVVVFHFRVRTMVESTELRFNPDYRLTTYKAFDDNYTPETANSFVFVDSLVQIVPDISLFIRGDTNGDGLVNISDPQATLNFLFLDGSPPYCLDGADANDDGVLDLSDAIYTLNYLFLDTAVTLPPPNGSPGTDPTADAMGCLE